MDRKIIARLSIDTAMLVLMLLQMTYQLTGNLLHELFGILTFILFIVHHILNLRWYKALAKGKYDIRRILNTTINMLLLAVMIILMVTSIMISRDIFALLGIKIGFIARQFHTFAANWGLVLMSVHLGMHWKMIIGAVKKSARVSVTSRIRIYILRVLSALIAVYGIYAFFAREVGSKLIMYYTFSYWSPNELLGIYFMDYLFIIGAFAYVTYYILKFVQNRNLKNKKKRTIDDIEF